MQIITCGSLECNPFALFCSTFIAQSNQLYNMAQKQLSEMTDEELKKNMRIMTIAVTVIIVSIIIMFISAVFFYIKKTSALLLFYRLRLCLSQSST
jgi:hypothetical protein